MGDVQAVRSNFDLSAWRLDTADGIVRLPYRQKAMRPPNFEDRYDAQTVFYDVFWSTDGTSVTIIAAPFLDLAQTLPFTLKALPSGTVCAVHSEPNIHYERLTVTPPAGTHALCVELAGQRIVLPIQPNGCETFQGRNLIYTLQKDNDLVWIRDWATFYVKEHGADAALVYDNGSTRYSTAQIANTLASVPGMAEVAVVDWSFPYGAFDCREELSYGIFDAAYCQVAAFEHVRRRFAGTARGYANVDLDELIVKRGTAGLFDALDAAPSGYLRVPGYWGENARTTEDAAEPQRRHRQFPFVAKGGGVACEPKWVVQPGRLSPFAVLHIHAVYNARSAEPSEFCLYHFRGINTMWDHERMNFSTRRSQEHVFDDASHQIEPELAAALARVFDGDDGSFADRRPAPDAPSEAYIARLRSGEAQRAGEMQRARALAEAAIGFDPTVQSFYEHLAQLLDEDDPRAAEARAEAAALRENAFGMHFIKGRQVLVREGLEAAFATLEKAHALDPTNEAGCHLWLMCLRDLGRTDEIAAVARSVIENAPGIRSVEIVTNTLCQKDQVAEALELAGLAVTLRPHSASIRAQLARIQIRAGALDAARESLDEATALATHENVSRELAKRNTNTTHPPEAALWPIEAGGFESLYAELALAQKRPADAARHMRAFAEGQYPNAMLMRRLASLCDAAGDAEGLKAARAMAARIRAFPALTKPQPDQGARALARWTADRVFDEVHWLVFDGKLEEADRLIAASAQVLDATFYLDCCRLAHSRKADAWAAARAEDALERDPDLVPARVLLMFLRQGEGRFEDAAKAAREVIARAPRHTGAHTVLFASLNRLERGKEAAEAARAAMMLCPEVKAFALNAGRSVLAQGEAKSALKLVAEGLKRWPSSFELHMLNGYILMKLDRPAEALPAAQAAAALAPDDGRASLLAARAAGSVGETSVAIDAFKAHLAQTKDPNGAVFKALSNQLLKENRFEEALSAAQEALARGEAGASKLAELA
ncbi:MAG: hypothetical protein AAGF49_01480, partial [Pseudomonadota bacterium]